MDVCVCVWLQFWIQSLTVRKWIQDWVQSQYSNCRLNTLYGMGRRHPVRFTWRRKGGRANIKCVYMWCVKCLYKGLICITKSIFYSGICDSCAMSRTVQAYHTYSHVKYKALSTCYKAETLCCFTCGLFEYVPRSKCIVRRDQTGWFIQVSNCALPLNTTSSIISVILRAIWEISWLSFSSMLDGCRKIHTLKSARRQCGTL